MLFIMHERVSLREKINIGTQNHPIVLCFIYLVYILIISIVLIHGTKELIAPIVVPSTIIIGMFIWKWQENIKKHNERAELIFKYYNQYEKSIQKIYALTVDLNEIFRVKTYKLVTEFEGIYQIVENMHSEIKKSNDIRLELYNNLVLFFRLKSDGRKFSSAEKRHEYIYSEAVKNLNYLHQYHYITKELSSLITSYKYSGKAEQERELDFQIKWDLKTKNIIQSFNFGFGPESKEVIYLKPRLTFLKLTNFK